LKALSTSDAFTQWFEREKIYAITKDTHIYQFKQLQKNTIGILSFGLSLTCYCPDVLAEAVLTNTNTEQKSWLLPNGQVQISNPLTSFPSRTLRNPALLGSGGGGSVFALQQDGSDTEVALKISWVASAESVERECKIFNLLEEKHTRNVERCLGKVIYPYDDRRVMIALEPVVNYATAAVSEVDEAKQPDCVRSIAKTLVDMLASNVVTTDVQALINKSTGEVSWKCDSRFDLEKFMSYKIKVGYFK
jgi:hypothetical protein